jgi:phosphoribosylanthranilate isomerase
MTTPKVKICGITNWTDAWRACEGGADFLGFNFYRKSPRYISPRRAGKIVARLPKGVAAVGVFVNESEAKVAEIARAVGLDYVQLHGDEPPEAVTRLARGVRGVKVIKALRVRQGFRTAELEKFRDASAFLLDGFDRRARGGTGKKFDWRLAQKVQSGPSSKRGGRRIFLAGGLTVENVAEANRRVKPFALDVCSGVESAPGKKDAARVKAFMAAVRNGKKR